MATKVTPLPDRFSIRRAGTPDRLAPAIVVPASPDTAAEPPVPSLPVEEPARLPAHTQGGEAKRGTR